LSKFKSNIKINYNTSSVGKKLSHKKTGTIRWTVLEGSSFAGILHTGQQSCYDLVDNSEEPCTTEHDGQDGYNDGTPKSFTDKGNNIIKDNHLGIMWTTNESEDIDTKAEAIALCSNLVQGNYNDWRLPNIVELVTVMGSNTSMPYESNPSPHGNTWSNGTYWSTTNTTGLNYGVKLFNDSTIPYSQGTLLIEYSHNGWATSASFVICVRDYPSDITLTDGISSQKNFVDLGNQIVADYNTGFLWAKDSHYDVTSWAATIDYCNNLIISGYDNWRLPTVSEIVTLVDYSCRSESDNGCFGVFKSNVFEYEVPGDPNDGKNNAYLSGTTASATPTGAYNLLVDSGTGYIYNGVKSGSTFRCIHDPD